ncbi:hypothetical protein UA75_10195 [Actinoalloteichus sp. GBA129-24]|uniref:Uncharacterized protein n=1 Tax=Actinoalloteichus fjordicus TaxID=1612552 RepID=A0AAC9PRT1_9PSEU|nr:hypothetical protein UA74_10215 [Actinoalloteichus fjordicus]APU20054.1 hypothetical protein UA75_10195 [Actinoalloteichus sp. GBA129-24]
MVGNQIRCLGHQWRRVLKDQGTCATSQPMTNREESPRRCDGVRDAVSFDYSSEPVAFVREMETTWRFTPMP